MWYHVFTSCPISGSKNESIPYKLHKVDVYTHKVVKLVNCVNIGIEPFTALFCNSLHITWKHTITEILTNAQLLKLQYLQRHIKINSVYSCKESLICECTSFQIYPLHFTLLINIFNNSLTYMHFLCLIITSCKLNFNSSLLPIFHHI